MFCLLEVFRFAGEVSFRRSKSFGFVSSVGNRLVSVRRKLKQLVSFGRSENVWFRFASRFVPSLQKRSISFPLETFGFVRRSILSLRNVLLGFVCRSVLSLKNVWFGFVCRFVFSLGIILFRFCWR